MDEYLLIKKERLKSFLKAAMKDYRLISPQPAMSGDFLFQETKDLDRINLDYDITSNTLKEFFFPAREDIFGYEKRKDGSIRITSDEKIEPDTIFFNLRSCDIRAVYFHDRFFGQEPKDGLYWRRRDRSVLIAFACGKPPHQSCFCGHMYDSGPVLEKGDGFDLQFIDLAIDIYLVEVGTSKGDSLIKRYNEFFAPAGHDMGERKERFRRDCLKRFHKEYDIQSIYEKLKKSTDLQGLWDSLGRRCTNCGGCEFICPSCFCFYSQDTEDSKGKGQRIRSWDSCSFAGYSRMAGGINPHEENSDRIARRFFCKLYNCHNWFGVFGCTGCGRCSFVCPVNLDMESFISSLMETNAYQALLKEL